MLTPKWFHMYSFVSWFKIGTKSSQKKNGSEPVSINFAVNPATDCGFPPKTKLRPSFHPTVDSICQEQKES